MISQIHRHRKETDREKRERERREKRNQTWERGGRANENIRMVQGKGNDVMGRQKCAGISLGEPEPSQREMDGPGTDATYILLLLLHITNRWIDSICPSKYSNKVCFVSVVLF